MKTMFCLLILSLSISCFANPVGGVLGGGEESQQGEKPKDKNVKVNGEEKPCKKIDENAEYIIWQCKK